MNVCFFSESSADEAALAILADAILGKRIQAIAHHGSRHRGWPAVRIALPAVLKQIHYHSDAECLILVVDSNGSQPHLPTHEPVGNSAKECRLCQLRQIAEQTIRHVRPRTTGPALKVALGLAVPALEAWLLCGVNPGVTEAAWINGLKDNRGKMPFTTSGLKRQLYDTDRPSLPTETRVMQAAAKRVASNLSLLQASFPYGFGALRHDLMQS